MAEFESELGIAGTSLHIGHRLSTESTSVIVVTEVIGISEGTHDWQGTFWKKKMGNALCSLNVNIYHIGWNSDKIVLFVIGEVAYSQDSIIIHCIHYIVGSTWFDHLYLSLKHSFYTRKCT